MSILSNSNESRRIRLAEIAGRRFYVTVRDAGRVGYLLGPYASNAVALANVERGRARAMDGNSRAYFYAYGTSSLPAGGEAPRTVFGA